MAEIKQPSQNLLLSKYQLELGKLANEESQEPGHQFLNSSGLVSPYKLILTGLLILCSIAAMQKANTSHWPHVRALTNYFSILMLGQDNLSIYDNGDNVDETYIEIQSYSQMKRHFQGVVDIVNKYNENGFVTFDNKQQQKVTVEMYYSQGAHSEKILLDFQGFKKFFERSDLKDMLLQLRVLYIEIFFGEGKFLEEFVIALDYEIYSHSMLKLQMNTRHTPKSKNSSTMKLQNFLRIFIRLFSGLLMIAYAKQTIQIHKNKQLTEAEKKSTLYWCYFLAFLNILSLTITQLSPFCSTLQLLPIFENKTTSENFAYNFNINLRYTWPFILRIILPVYMILNGFILYSSVYYSSSYFDDYVSSFFSYFYNNYQYGIYEIFQQIRQGGRGAYVLYLILYFYMVMVGSNLIPALFCTFIYRKMAEKQLIRFVESLLEEVACPFCQHYENGDSCELQININSPKSPYLKSQTLKNASPLQKGKTLKNVSDRKRRISIDEEDYAVSPVLSPKVALKNKHRRAKRLVSQLEQCFHTKINNRIAQQKLKQVQEILEKF